ncbi:MAG TPA: hypothetical protein DD456_12265 [Stenotrophomonas sp.]|nr:hypothetical protein [Stenotrophomonas sp.]
MAITIEERQNVHVMREAYAADIRIRANPVDTAAGSISMELHQLEYWDDEFERMDPIGTIGETVGDFAQRTFEIDGKTITGMEVVKLIKQYVADLHAEREAHTE